MQNSIVSGISGLVLRALLLGSLVMTPLRADSVSAQTASSFSCSAPADAAERTHCAALEKEVLDATIYMLFRLSCGQHGADSGQSLVMSHATVVDERTVLTHNHYGWLDKSQCVLTALHVFASRGEQLAQIKDPAQLDDLVSQLRPNLDGSRGQALTVTFPESLFVPSRIVIERFASQPGDDALTGWGELAEINWRTYPRETYVQWVNPATIELREQALGLVVQKAVQVGASGGGVFRIVNGQIHHIGNVWATRQQNDTSIVALNLTATIR